MNERVSNLIAGMIQTERSRRNAPTAAALREITDQFTRAAALGHGRYPVLLDAAAAHEYEFRANKWLEIIRRVMFEIDVSWTSERTNLLTHLLEQELTKDWEELVAALQERMTTRTTGLRIDELDRAKDRTRNHIRHELELLVLRQDQTKVPIVEQLQAPRYVSVLTALNKAFSLIDREPADYANAVKEAVSSVEQLGRIVTEMPTATLGDIVKELKRSATVKAPLLKGIEEIWGWTSGTPGVRHGSAATVQVDITEARYILRQAEAAVGLLLAVDV